MCVSFDKLTKIFKETTDKHAPQNKERIGDSQASFMTKELSKQIMKRSKSKNLYFKWPSRENFFAHENEKKQNKNKQTKKPPKSKCNNMTKYAENSSFFTNRGIITNDSITLEENRVLKKDPKETTEVFNKYVNLVETTAGKQSSSMGNPNSQC